MTLHLETHYRAAVSAAERRVSLLLERQERTGPRRGGFPNHADGMVHPGAAIGSLITMVPVLVNPDSAMCGSAELAEGIEMALEFAHGIQREDGTFDLLPSNFYSSPDNGFMMHNLARCHRLLTGSGRSYPEIEQSLYRLIETTGGGMVRGGFHTPNHRWVIAAALAMAHNITRNPVMLDEAKRYLAEGIDVDEHGEFTERSSGIYNAVNDNALIILSEELGDESLLDPVTRNLDMMFSYVEPDSSLFTWNSTRQDKGEGPVGESFSPNRYYSIYLAMLARRPDRRYAWMAEQIYNRSVARGGPGSLYRFMLDPELKVAVFETEAPSTDFSRFYPASRIVRIRRGARSVTVLAGSTSFLFVQTPSISCRVKLCASFFSVAQFSGETIEEQDGSYRMRFETHADYRLPLEPPPSSPVWAEMDHRKRARVKDQLLVFDVTIREVEHGVELSVGSAGCERVPVKLELILSSGTTIHGREFVLPASPGGSITVGDGEVTAESATDRVTIGPAFSEHWYAESMRGSEPQSQTGFTVYFTDYTPVARTVTITTQSA